MPSLCGATPEIRDLQVGVSVLHSVQYLCRAVLMDQSMWLQFLLQEQKSSWVKVLFIVYFKANFTRGVCITQINFYNWKGLIHLKAEEQFSELKFHGRESYEIQKEAKNVHFNITFFQIPT